MCRCVLLFFLLPLTTLLGQTHQVQIENMHSRNLRKLVIDDVIQVGPIASGDISEFVELRPGGHKVFAMFEGGGNVYLDHRFFLRGTRFSKWTLRLKHNRRWTLKENPPGESVRSKTVPQSLPAAVSKWPWSRDAVPEVEVLEVEMPEGLEEGESEDIAPE